VTGLAGFTAASFWCGVTHGGGELVLARILQGAAAALMVPQVLATIHRQFEGEERSRAFGIYGATLGLGAAVGFELGGLLVSFDLAGMGWRSIFFVNVPVGLALILAALWLMPPAPRTADVNLDVAGAGVLFLTLLCLLGPLVLGRDLARPHWLLGVMIVGIALLAVFLRIESGVERRGGLPLVPLGLLANGPLLTGLAAVIFFAFANIAFYLALTIYMQVGLRYTPLQSGATVLPLALAFAAASRVLVRRAQRRGLPALIEGCGVQILGLLLVAGAVAWRPLEPAVLGTLLVVFGVGQAMVMAPLYNRVLGMIPATHAGSGAGILSMIQQIGNGAGVATIGAIYFALQSRYSDRIGFLAALAVLATALVATAALLRLLQSRHRAVRP
jgi:predicted MFS family arabinose efflux permease